MNAGVNSISKNRSIRGVGSEYSRRGTRGLGIDFIRGLAKLIESDLDPENVKEISLVYGTSRLDVRQGKHYSCLTPSPSYLPDLEGFLREIKLPYERVGEELRIYSDLVTKDRILQYEEAIEKSRKEGNEDVEREILIDLRLTIGDPSCCAVTRGKFIVTGKPLHEHPFFEEARRKVEDIYKNEYGISMSAERLPAIAIKEYLIRGELYPNQLLLRGEMIPHSINCEAALSMCEEWESFLIGLEDLLYPTLQRMYQTGECQIVLPVKRRKAIEDALEIKKRKCLKN